MIIRGSEAESNKVWEPPIRGAMYRVVSLALDLLESQDAVSFRALVDIGASAVERWRKEGKKIIYPRGRRENQGKYKNRPSHEEMKKWALVFLGRVRHSFVAVRVDRINRCVPLASRLAGSKEYGSFRRYKWMPWARERCKSDNVVTDGTNVMERWDPLDAGEMELDLEVRSLLLAPSRAIFHALTNPANRGARVHSLGTVVVSRGQGNGRSVTTASRREL
jgi:hypothetical protein